MDEDAAEVESEDAAEGEDVQPLNLTTKRADLIGGGPGKKLRKQQKHMNNAKSQWERLCRVQILAYNFSASLLCYTNDAL